MSEPRKRILLVDDDVSILESVEVALRERGYEVIVARDGAEGLMRAERDAPDLIVLDVVMPKRSGLTVLDRIRCRQRHVPRIIVLTANQEQRHRDFAESRGADLFLQKPVEIEHLIAAVEKLLRA